MSDRRGPGRNWEPGSCPESSVPTEMSTVIWRWGWVRMGMNVEVSFGLDARTSEGRRPVCPRTCGTEFGREVRPHPEPTDSRPQGNECLLLLTTQVAGRLSWAELGQVAAWPRTAERDWLSSAALSHALGSASWSAWQTAASLVSKRARPRSQDGRGRGPRRTGLRVQSPSSPSRGAATEPPSAPRSPRQVQG